MVGASCTGANPTGMSGRRSPKVMPANSHDMSPLDSFLEQAWNDHAGDAPAVAARLPAGLPLAQDADGVMRLAALAHHVLGEHLGRWPEGLAFLAQLAERGTHGADAAAAI